MKTLTLLLLFPCLLQAQISATMRIGYNFKYEQAIISPAIDFAAHGIHLTTEMIVNPAKDKPASFGLKGSYEYRLGNCSIQAGAGRYFDLFSTDNYDKYLNGWSNMYFGAVHWRKWYVEYGYMNGSIISIGVRELLSEIQ